MPFGTQRLIFGGNGGKEIVFLTPSTFALVKCKNLTKLIREATGKCPDLDTLKITDDVHEALRHELALQHQSRVDKVYALHGLWVEILDGERMLRIE